MTIVRFYEPTFMPDGRLTYSVVSGRYDNKWIFVRHRNRSTWEIAGGHIEPGESADEAAHREFMEETGAQIFTVHCIATYSVEMDGETGYGRLYFADVRQIGPIPGNSEIAETQLLDYLPESLTHPDIQPLLFQKALEFYNKMSSRVL
jgi:8-oxo-dGTP diphosphatase